VKRGFGVYLHSTCCCLSLPSRMVPVTSDNLKKTSETNSKLFVLYDSFTMCFEFLELQISD